MEIVYGDMWSCFETADLFCITTNSTISYRLAANGALGVALGNIERKPALVMGAGIARQARDYWQKLEGVEREAWRNIDILCGQAVVDACGELGDYGLLVSKSWPQSKLALFQTKRHWRDKSNLELIELSSRELEFWCNKHPGKQVHLNFPGIGCGQLKESEVLAVINPILGNIEQLKIWKLKG